MVKTAKASMQFTVYQSTKFGTVSEKINYNRNILFREKNILFDLIIDLIILFLCDIFLEQSTSDN